VTIAILDFGMGNLLSVERALRHVGADAEITGDPARARGADALVVPGVGHFGACMRGLEERGLGTAVREFAAGGRPVFGVCVGLQVLFEGSEEDGDAGLGILPGVSRRLGDPEGIAAEAGIKVPHMGWNEVSWTRAHPYVADLPDGERFYFVHSYAPDVDDLTVGRSEHGRPFAAVVARDNVFATQFHPEKSGDAGLHVYERFAKEVAAA
jgi:imidazole glycerol-phosphate synthase subunit HisH